MAIVTPPDEPRHPAPHSLHRLAITRHTGRGVYTTAVSTGAELADLIDALGVIPIDTHLVGVEVPGELDADGAVVLVFRQIPPPVPLAAARRGGGPAPAAPEQPAPLDLIAA
jgi:hypothetical protein